MTDDGHKNLQRELLNEFCAIFERQFQEDPSPMLKLTVDWVCSRLASLMLMTAERVGAKVAHDQAAWSCTRNGHDFEAFNPAPGTALHLQGQLYCRKCGKTA